MDGDFARKAALFEEVDAQIPRIEALGPAAFVVTSDHSTPAVHKAHSWHPVPALIWGPHCRSNAAVGGFGETACLSGALGSIRGMDLLPLVLAQAGRLGKFGA